jgi:hypothetical protein
MPSQFVGTSLYLAQTHARSKNREDWLHLALVPWRRPAGPVKVLTARRDRLVGQEKARWKHLPHVHHAAIASSWSWECILDNPILSSNDSRLAKRSRRIPAVKVGIGGVLMPCIQCLTIWLLDVNVCRPAPHVVTLEEFANGLYNLWVVHQIPCPWQQEMNLEAIVTR